MRRKVKPRTTRTIKRFLFFPRTIDGEQRWLEWARIEQQFVVCDPVLDRMFYWEDVAWGD